MQKILKVEVTNVPDKSQALLEGSSQLSHSDPRITERYVCLEEKNVEAGKQRMSFIYDKQCGKIVVYYGRKIGQGENSKGMCVNI